jgi:hypothetical protein
MVEDGGGSSSWKALQLEVTDSLKRMRVAGEDSVEGKRCRLRARSLIGEAVRVDARPHPWRGRGVQDAE